MKKVFFALLGVVLSASTALGQQTYPLLLGPNTWSTQQIFGAGLQTGNNIVGTTTTGAYSIGADSTFGAAIGFYGSTSSNSNLLSLAGATITLNGGSGGTAIVGTPVGLSKLSAAPTSAPGAGKALLFFVAGTNSGTCKLQAMAGTSATPVTVLDNIGSGC